jgi:hypothetical protein
MDTTKQTSLLFIPNIFHQHACQFPSPVEVFQFIWLYLATVVDIAFGIWRAIELLRQWLVPLSFAIPSCHLHDSIRPKDE